jgi:hypothetical protein
MFPRFLVKWQALSLRVIHQPLLQLAWFHSLAYLFIWQIVQDKLTPMHEHFWLNQSPQI